MYIFLEIYNFYKSVIILENNTNDEQFFLDIQPNYFNVRNLCIITFKSTL